MSAETTGLACAPLENILRRQAKHDLTDRLVVQYPPLALLRDRVDVAQAGFERIFPEHAHGAAVVKQRGDDLPGRLNGPGGGEAQAAVTSQANHALILDRFQR